jgi:maleylacetate reductase
MTERMTAPPCSASGAVGTMAFTRLERVLFGSPAARAAAGEAARLGAERVFILASKTLNRQTDVVRAIASALEHRFVGTYDAIPAHAPRDAVIACAAKARDANADLLVTVGGGSVIDAAKVVAVCLEHDLRDSAALERFRTTVDGAGKRHFPDYREPTVRLVCIPTTLSGGEFNFRAGITDTEIGVKQSFAHPGLVPRSVILDPAATVHTPQALFLSTGVRAIDHAVETLGSIDANAYTDGMALQALRLLGRGLPAVKRDSLDLAARTDCQIGAWMSMTGVVAGTRMGASHAIGHILGGSAGVPHGYASCVMLPAVLAFNAGCNAASQAQVSATLGEPEVDAAQVLDAFITGLGLPRRLRDVGVAYDDLPRLAAHCLDDDWTFSNPRPIRTADDVLAILQKAY